MDIPPGGNNSVPKTAPVRLVGLDGLRALAVTAVILVHLLTTEGFPKPRWLVAVASPGGAGVTVFFVISGFLITWLLLREERETGRISLSRFYFRRAIRILPAAFCYLAVLALVGPWVGIRVNFLSFLGSAVFVKNWLPARFGGLDNHFWSLSIEEQFYLFWPFLLRLVPARARVPATASLLLALPVWRQANIWWWGADNMNWSRTDLRLDTLVTGCLLALLMDSPQWQPRLKALATRPSVLFLVAAAGFVGPSWGLVSTRWLPGQLSIMLNLMAIAGMILGLVEMRSGPIFSLMNCGPMVWIGRMSYSLYLWQEVFCIGFTRLPFQRFPLNVLLTLLAGAASYFLVEQPLLRRRERWQAAWFGARPANPPVPGPVA